MHIGLFGASPWTIQKDDKRYSNTDLKINCCCNSESNNKTTDDLMVTIIINKISTFLMFSLERQGRRARNFKIMIRKIRLFMWYKNLHNFEKIPKESKQAHLRASYTIIEVAVLLPNKITK